MSLSLELYYERLQQVGADCQLLIPEKFSHKEYDLPRVFMGGSYLDEGFYILRPDQCESICQTHPDVAIIAIGFLPPLFKGPAILVSNLTYEAVWSVVLETQRELGRLYMQMERGHRDGANVQYLLELAGQYTPNPISLVDSENVVVAHYMRDTSEQELYSLIGQKIPLNWSHDCAIDDVSGFAEGRLLKGLRAETKATDSYVYSICQDTAVYFLSITSYTAPLSATDIYLVNTLIPFIERTLKGIKLVRNSNAFTCESIFRNTLADPMFSKQATQRGLALVNMDVQDTWACLVFQIDWKWSLKLPVEYMATQIQRRIVSGCAFLYDSNICAFVNLTRANCSLSDALDNLKDFIRNYHFKAGVSTEFFDATLASEYYGQALSALEYNNYQHLNKPIYHFKDCALEHILHYGTTRLSPQTVCSAALLALVQYDKENDTEFVHTLETYYRNKMNSSQTAKDLYIHRSTFLYRMEQIQKILNLDIEDYDTMLYLMVSLKLL